MLLTLPVSIGNICVLLTLVGVNKKQPYVIDTASVSIASFDNDWVTLGGETTLSWDMIKLS